MKHTCILLVLLSAVIGTQAQEPAFHIKFSEPLAVFEFVNDLSADAPDNPFKKAFDSSAFDRDKYKTLLAAFDTLNIDYSYEYTRYPYAQKIGGSTASLLEKTLIGSPTINDFKLSAIGIIPNVDLFKLCTILTEFTPVYEQLIYRPNKRRFDDQLSELGHLLTVKNIPAYWQAGLIFYHSSWDSSIPFTISLYPLPGSKHFTATAMYDDAISALPTGLKDYNKLLSVMLHETFHILYDEQSLLFKKDIQKWFTGNPSKSSRYAYLLMNEALATALGNGYVYGQLSGAEDTAAWYHRKYINLMAKKIYPLVKSYILQKRAMDKAFVDQYIQMYDDNFAGWLLDVNNIMTDRYVLSDNPDDFTVIDRKFPYRSMSDYENGISEGAIGKMKQAPITKIIIVSKNNKEQLGLIKRGFTELGNWVPDDRTDFSYPVFLGDKTWLIVINDVQKTTEEQIETLRLP